MKTFGQLQVGDKIYIIDNKCYSFEPNVDTIVGITKKYTKNGVYMEIETEDLGTICPEINCEDNSIGWDSSACWDVYTDNEELTKRLLSKIEELSNFCLNEL